MDFSIVITNYNRKDELANVIETALMQDFEGFEVIVVDNASTDGSPEIVRERYPQVRLLVQKENLGAVGRNRGFEVSRGKYIVSLDNDVYFRTPNELSKLYKVFKKSPKVGCVNFRIFAPSSNDPDITNWCHPRDLNVYFDKTFETDYISEGASAFRKAALDRVGLYYYPFFIGHEGDDLAVRLIDAGYKILYCPEIEVCHIHSSTERPSWRTYYFHTRNSIWFFYKNFRLLFVAKYIPWYLIIHLFFALKNKRLRAYLKGVLDGFKGLPKISIDRQPVSLETERRIKELRKHKPPILKRALKHLRNDLFLDSRINSKDRKGK